MDSVETDDPSDTGDSRDASDFTCYCLKGRQVGKMELLCGGCGKWFHSECISCYIGKVMPFMTNYLFYCKLCNATGVESFTKKQANFSQMCLTALANLTFQEYELSTGRTLFSHDQEIVPYIDKWWDCLTTSARRVTLTWHTTIFKTMVKESDTFTYRETSTEESGDATYPMFGLKNPDLSKIAPNYDMFVPRLQTARGELQAVSNGNASIVGLRSRGYRRRVGAESQAAVPIKKSRSEPVSKLPPSGYPFEHPYNKDGYRYILADTDPHAPNRQEFDEGQDWAGKPIPGYFYRTAVLPRVILAPQDRAHQLKLSEDRLCVTGDKGYCMIRGTHGVHSGAWYFECTIEDMPPETATRIGWSQAYGNLQAPCGYDKFSYSWRSRKGTRFHQSKGKHYSSGYGEGDTLGCYIYLPNCTDSEKFIPPTVKDKPLVKFKNYLYFEEKDEVQAALKSLTEAQTSLIKFYKNGDPQGTAFFNMFEGIYYPAVSLYKNCTVSVNFGPNFTFPPDDVDFNPMSDRAASVVAEQTLSDLLFFAEYEGKLTLEMDIW